jgi:hypothetical protein
LKLAAFLLRERPHRGQNFGIHSRSEFLRVRDTILLYHDKSLIRRS